MPIVTSPSIRKSILSAITLLFIGVLLSSCQKGAAPGHSLEVATVGTYGGAISDDAQFGIVGSVHHGASLWRLADGERLFNWNHHKDEFSLITAADFSPDGKWALTTDDHTLVLWSMADGQAKRFWNSPGEVEAISLSRAGAYALLGLRDGTAVLFDVQRGGIRRTFQHQGVVHTVALNDAFTLAVTGSEDQTAKLWDLKTAKVLHEIHHDDEVQLVAFSPDGSLVFSAAKYDKALVWNANTGQEIGAIPLHSEKLRRGLRVTAVRFSRDNRELLTGFPDRTVQLWDLRTMQEKETWLLPKRDAWKPTSASVVDVGFSQQANQYIALASNGYIHQLQTPSMASR